MNIVQRASSAALCAALLCLCRCTSSTASIDPLAWQKATRPAR